MTPSRNTPAPGAPDGGRPPLTARSVVASTLLGVHPPVLPAAVLVRAGRLFAISDGTTRVAISRMVSAGELVADGGTYRLAGALADRQHRQDESRVGLGPGPGRKPAWSGGWRMAVVTATTRAAADRARLRAALARLRYAELREGVWARPDNLVHEEPAVVGAQCTWFEARPDGDPVALAALLWPLDAWAAAAVRLTEQLATGRPGLDTGAAEALAPGFLLDAAVLRHLQSDPLLPPALLPPGWPGDDLRAAYEDFDAAFKRAWRRWHAAEAGREP